MYRETGNRVLLGQDYCRVVILGQQNMDFTRGLARLCSTLGFVPVVTLDGPTGPAVISAVRERQGKIAVFAHGEPRTDDPGMRDLQCLPVGNTVITYIPKQSPSEIQYALDESALHVADVVFYLGEDERGWRIGRMAEAAKKDSLVGRRTPLEAWRFLNQSYKYWRGRALGREAAQLHTMKPIRLA